MLLRGVGLNSHMEMGRWRCSHVARSMAALARGMWLTMPFRMFLRAQCGLTAAVKSMRSEHVCVHV